MICITFNTYDRKNDGIGSRNPTFKFFQSIQVVLKKRRFIKIFNIQRDRHWWKRQLRPLSSISCYQR
ncbi:unnamed protein product [Blepharisma stoltei]|uniref:Uncharacterized protein n=1 Tax=Blepharisma stoltei TaxID=1481888 RepID=A0AAU9J6F6_9CILI|nr:unnamed protein product [Blepharisma stoltei]